MDMAADHDVFDHRHAGEYVRALKRSRQPGARDIVDTQTGNQRVVEMHLAFLRPIEPAQAIHQRGLAGTVWANHSQQFVSADRDRNIVKRHHTAERHSDFIGNKYGRVSARQAGDDGIGLNSRHVSPRRCPPARSGRPSPPPAGMLPRNAVLPHHEG